MNPYESLDNYKHGEEGGYLNVHGTTVTFSLPLYGQNADGAINTLYAFRIRAKTALATSSWTSVYYIDARATSAYDVVKAWNLNNIGEKVKIPGALGVNQIFVEELAALSANLGYITDGALHGDQYNYWAVNDTLLDDNTTLLKGSFRVGGERQYIQVTPKTNTDGTPTGEYDIQFVINDFTVDANGATSVKGNTFTVYNTSGDIMFQVSPSGNYIMVEEGSYTSDEPFLENSVQINTAFSGFFYNGSWYILGIESDRYFLSKNGGLLIDSSDNISASFECFLYKPSDNLYLKTSCTNTSVTFCKYSLRDNSMEEITLEPSFASGSTENLRCIAQVGSKVLIRNSTMAFLYDFYSSSVISVSDSLPDTTDAIMDADDNYIYMLSITLTLVVLSRVSLETGTVEVQATNIAFSGSSVFSVPLYIRKCHDRLVIYGNGLGIKSLEDSSELLPSSSRYIVLYDSDMAWGGSSLAHPYIYDCSSFSDGSLFSNDLSGIAYDWMTVDSEGKTTGIKILTPVDYETPEISTYYTKRGTLREKEISISDTIPCGFICSNNEENDQNIKYYISTMNMETGQSDIYSFAKVAAKNVEHLNTYRTGIGFTGIFYDRVNNRYRYYLETGAYVEFDDYGRLQATRGDPGAKGDTGATGRSIRNRNAWTSGTEYLGSPADNYIDVVSYEGSSYICRQKHTSSVAIIPTYTPYWTLMARKGEAGAHGTPGADGVSIQSVEQTQVSTESGGTNIITCTKSDGSQTQFSIKNGLDGGVICYSAGSEPNKVATATNFSRNNGVTFPLEFAEDNTYQGSLTLNINGTGASRIFICGKNSSSTNYTLPAGTYLCHYSAHYNAYYIETQYSVDTARWSNTSGIVENLTTTNLTQVVNKIYPVGSIYMSVNSTSPETLFGGTWVPISEGRVLIGAGAGSDGSESRAFTAGATGGEYTHQLSISEMPAHNHDINSSGKTGSTQLKFGWNNIVTDTVTSAKPTGTGAHVGEGERDRDWTGKSGDATKHLSYDGSHEHKISPCGGDAAHNNVQPYLVVYMWKRTA